MAIVIEQLANVVNIINDSKPLGEQIIDSLPIGTVARIDRNEPEFNDVVIFDTVEGIKGSSVKFDGAVYVHPLGGSKVLFAGNIEDLINELNTTYFKSSTGDTSGLALETTLQTTNTILNEIKDNTGGNYLDFSVSNGITEVDLGVAGNERLLLLFRCNPTELSGVDVKKMVASVHSSTNDNFLIVLGVAKTFDHVFIEDNFKNVDPLSKIQVAIPSVEGVPALVTATGFSVGGRNVFQQFGKQDSAIGVTQDTPANIPAGVYYSLTAIGFSANAKLASAGNWAEMQ